MDKYAVLQSGFLASSDADLFKNEFVRNPMVDYVLDKDHLKPKMYMFFNKEIDFIYNEWRAKPELLRDFDFRERVLKACFKAFNSKSIYSWFIFQKNSEYFTELHNKFVTDTIRFTLGYRREIQNVQWISLLEANIKDQAVLVSVDEYFDSEAKSGNAMASSSLVKFVKAWTSQPNGIEDLLVTLYVIFGDRPNVSDVADKNHI